jgi:hypothetical protein
MRAALPCVELAFQGDVLFRSDSTRALSHFHVLKNDFYVTNLKAEDVVLPDRLEKGSPR